MENITITIRTELEISTLLLWIEESIERSASLIAFIRLVKEQDVLVLEEYCKHLGKNIYEFNWERNNDHYCAFFWLVDPKELVWINVCEKQQREASLLDAQMYINNNGL